MQNCSTYGRVELKCLDRRAGDVAFDLRLQVLLVEVIGSFLEHLIDDLIDGVHRLRLCHIYELSLVLRVPVLEGEVGQIVVDIALVKLVFIVQFGGRREVDLSTARPRPRGPALRSLLIRHAAVGALRIRHAAPRSTLVVVVA